jgi:hypothetical protein
MSRPFFTTKAQKALKGESRKRKKAMKEEISFYHNVVEEENFVLLVRLCGEKLLRLKN